NALLGSIASDISHTKSSLLYSLAFLYQTPGVIQDAIKTVMEDPQRFVYGISDRKVGGLDIQAPDGTIAPVYPSQLAGAGRGWGGGAGVLSLVGSRDHGHARAVLGSPFFYPPAGGRGRRG